MARTAELRAGNDSSMPITFAPATGGFTLRAWTMPGTFMSTAYGYGIRDAVLGMSPRVGGGRMMG